MKQEAGLPIGQDYSEADEVNIELLPGHTHEELVDVFKQQGAPAPEVLAPGFYSGKVPLASRQSLHSIARVQPKIRKKMH